MQLVTTDQQLSLPASWKRGKGPTSGNPVPFLLWVKKPRSVSARGKRVVCNVYLDCSLHFQVHDLFLLEWLDKSLYMELFRGHISSLTKQGWQLGRSWVAKETFFALHVS